MSLKKTDTKIYSLIQKEKQRQEEKLVMIASENYTSKAVREALGSVLTHKYSEGEPGKRYYQGNEFIDEIENLTNARALKVFGLSPKKWHVNCKANSASLANLAVLTALLEPGDKILAMDLTHGGHLSHGWKLPSGKPISFSAKIFAVSFYGVNKKTGVFNYNEIAKKAKKFFGNQGSASRQNRSLSAGASKGLLGSEGGETPNGKVGLLITGGTAYARDINYKKMAAIAKSVGAYYLADIAHEAGLIAGKALSSPFPFADAVTMSTQKTLRGPRGSIIICREDLKDKIDHALFPGLMGGPSDNVIAAIGVCLKEAMTPQFKNYARQTIKNAKILAAELKKYGFHIVSGGTDKHLVLLDLRNKNINGSEAAILLDQAGIVCNKNTVPLETGSPFRPSGIRLGTPALTTRGMKEKEMKKIACWIDEILNKKNAPANIQREVKMLTNKFPIKY